MMHTKKPKMKTMAIVLFALGLPWFSGTWAEEEKAPESGGFKSRAFIQQMVQMMPGQTEKSEEKTKEGDVDDRRDPFAVTRELASRKKSASTTKSKSSEVAFTASAQPDVIPAMKLRGHLQDKDNETVALLEIEGGGVHIVREGDTLGLHDLGYNSVIQIKKISRLHLVIESGTLGQLIIVR